MLDNLNPSSPRDGRDGHKSAPRARDHEVRPVVEREVPLGQQADRALASSVHAWLDGELPEAAVRKGDTMRDVEFWKSLNDQMDRTRRMRTPEYVEAQIMSALPHHAPSLITPWYRREFVVTPVAAVSIGAALVTVAIAATVLFMAG
ncbi:MAG TPA: hypothetical protein VJ867_15000 [Gemmatimonadaceae bacterium]|nr:hypothetical protein [Gemmatimonadaceae bacterium]